MAKKSASKQVEAAPIVKKSAEKDEMAPEVVLEKECAEKLIKNYKAVHESDEKKKAEVQKKMVETSDESVSCICFCTTQIWCCSQVKATPIVEKSAEKDKRTPEVVLEKESAKKLKKDEAVHKSNEKKKVEVQKKKVETSDDEPKVKAPAKNVVVKPVIRYAGMLFCPNCADTVEYVIESWHGGYKCSLCPYTYYLKPGEVMRMPETLPKKKEIIDFIVTENDGLKNVKAAESSENENANPTEKGNAAEVPKKVDLSDI